MTVNVTALTRVCNQRHITMTVHVTALTRVCNQRHITMTVHVNVLARVAPQSLHNCLRRLMDCFPITVAANLRVSCR